MADDVAALLQKMRNNPKGIRFAELKKVCEHYFGDGRQSGGSHLIFSMPWPNDPRVNIQDDKGAAKPYQVRQVIRAVDRKIELEAERTKQTENSGRKQQESNRGKR